MKIRVTSTIKSYSPFYSDFKIKGEEMCFVCVLFVQLFLCRHHKKYTFCCVELLIQKNLSIMIAIVVVVEWW